ncbi:hypothetical protein BAUCODRAFT_29962 [Baudoinia panamericana UAMH 10762]|uniref:Uncharacterized protein n=1 Tax=Baudoinia panamericana (strain UAMH 10762) TaxID=717646 RepID=M2N6A5_BAUPA|nr:uncharacterized protein BAUCODRAFT_29962 [Baudoinia panamericana UAMH 10762]EMC99588.1 hypothetical protein BAUCODRAFT_29962 [Baudoinia panamericana UAMH 10762]
MVHVGFLIPSVERIFTAAGLTPIMDVSNPGSASSSHHWLFLALTSAIRSLFRPMTTEPEMVHRFSTWTRRPAGEEFINLTSYSLLLTYARHLTHRASYTACRFGVPRRCFLSMRNASGSQIVCNATMYCPRWDDSPATLLALNFRMIISLEKTL